MSLHCALKIKAAKLHGETHGDSLPVRCDKISTNGSGRKE